MVLGGGWGLFGAIGVIRAGGAIQNAIFPTRGRLLIFAVQHTDLNGRTDLLCTQVCLAVDDQKIDANAENADGAKVHDNLLVGADEPYLLSCTLSEPLVPHNKPNCLVEVDLAAGFESKIWLKN